MTEDLTSEIAKLIVHDMQEVLEPALDELRAAFEEADLIMAAGPSNMTLVRASQNWIRLMWEAQLLYKDD